MDDAAKMYELQKVDLTWTKVRRRLMEIQKPLGETDELKHAREQGREDGGRVAFVAGQTTGRRTGGQDAGRSHYRPRTTNS